MSFKTNKIKKTVVVFLCFFFFSTSVGLVAFTPQKTHAILGAGDTVIEVGPNLINNIMTRIESVYSNLLLHSLYYKEWIADGIVWVAVKKKLADIVKKEIIDNIVSATDGVPAFINDPLFHSFYLKYETTDFALNDILANTNINALGGLFFEGADDDLASILDNKHLGDPNERVSQILAPTLESVVNSDGNFAEFKEGNFYEGGWAGFFSLTQNAKNNALGSYFLTEEAVAQVTHDFEQASLNELSWGSGYYGQRNADGLISAPGQLLSDQLNEGLTSDMRSMENADEVLEGLAVLIGQLIGNVIGGDGLLDGSYSGIETTTVEGSEVDIPDPQRGGGGFVSTTTDIYVDIEDAFIQIASGSIDDLDFESDPSTVMRMQNPTSSDNTIWASSIEVPSLTVICDDGYNSEIGEDTGEYITINNATVNDPVFETLSSSEAVNVGEIYSATILADMTAIYSDAEYAHITTLNVELDINAANDEDYENAVFGNLNGTASIGDTIEALELNSIVDIVSTEVGLDGVPWGESTSIRGGTTQTPSTMTLNNVVLIGGTVEHNGEICQIVSYDDRVCDVNEIEGFGDPCEGQPVSGITGDDLQIVDSRDAWAIMNPSMATILNNATVEVDGRFELTDGTITKVYD